ncbi:MAG TPA: serine/threonine-protein kinase [Bryobacteraceae bacterium]|nr:serine/threonine-protein kinase [Bryobacteraceae bacterium]
MIAPASRKIGKYEILRKLGRGGMADVYLAQDTAGKSAVALKLIEHAADADTHDAIEAERRGAVLQAHLAAVDPRVVSIYDSGDADGYFYVAMEYIDGQDLAELLRRGPLQVEYSVDVARAVAQTLDNAHNLQVAIDGKDFHGIVHGDIKPKNIRIDGKGEVRVLDFGIAKALSLSRKLTRNEFGSVPYGSPERLEAGEVNVLSDLWSLAVMLYEMLTGLQPYQAETTERLERMIRSRIPPPPVPDPCPEPLRRILIKAMAPDAEVRYQSARELDEELAAFRNGGTVKAVTEDLEATRRTRRPEVDDDTRKTGAEAGATEETRRTTAKIYYGTWPPAKAKTRKPMPVGVARALWGAGFVAVVVVTGLVLSSVMLHSRGKQFAREIESEQVTDTNDIWNRWTELSKGNPSSWLLGMPRKAVEQKLVSAADQVIDSYRNSDAVYENSWKSARDELAHALLLDPDNTVRGKLRLCEGHLARIDGIAHKSAPELNLAVQKFNEAQQLMPRSPDPELGLARVYVYGLKDIDRAYQALQQAEQRGFALGNREKSQLADGYRDRGDRLFWDSRNVRGMPQEKDEVERARDDYARALQLYQGIAPYGNANAGILRVQKSIESVDSRLQQIEQESTSGPAGAVKRALPDWLKPFVHIWQ